MKHELLWAFDSLYNQNKVFKGIEKLSFDPELHKYLRLLLGLGVITGVLKLLFFIIRGVVLDLIFNSQVQYIRLVNYALGEAVATVFFVLFAGTFLMILLSLLLWPFFKVKYVLLLKVLFVSVTPLLLFGWITSAIPGLIVWSGLRFYCGKKVVQKNMRDVHGTIEER